jgi:hypothetical protein
MFLVELDESDARQAARATVQVKEDGGQRLAGREKAVSIIRTLPLHYYYLLLGSES